jgi:hypothetical protein
MEAVESGFNEVINFAMLAKVCGSDPAEGAAARRRSSA